MRVNKSKAYLTMAGAVVFMLSGVSGVRADDTATAVSRVGDAMVNAVNKQGIFDWMGGSVGYVDKKTHLGFNCV